MQPNYNPEPVAVTSDKKEGASQPSLGKTFSIVAILTVLSKVVGLVRDIVVAHAYGTGIVADAYNYAYLFTGNILILFGGLGGPFHSATVAILTPRKDDENAGKLVLQVFVFTLIALLIISAIAFVCAPMIAAAMAGSYKDQIVVDKLPEVLKHLSKEQLGALFQGQLLQQFVIMLPLIIISGLVGISYGVLNVYNRIFWPSLSPAIASVAIIIAVMFFADPTAAIYTGVPLAVGTLLGAVGQLLAQIPDTLKTKLKWSFSMQADEGWHEYSKMIWPAVFSTSVGQLIVYVDMYFTLNGPNLGQGAWTAILMSNRLVQLPLGVLLTAMLVPILPRFTEQVNANKMEDLKDEIRRSLRLLWFLALPLTALFLVIPQPIIRLLFQHGEFTDDSSRMVTIALLLLAPSIFFYVARDLITRVFYAFKDSKTPFHVALVAIVVKAILDWYFVYHTNLGVGAISLASTAITMVNLSLLTWFLKKRIGFLGVSHLLKPLFVMFLASGLCAAAAYGVSAAMSTEQALQWVAHIAPTMSHWIVRLQLLAGVGSASLAGGLVYVSTCVIFKLEEPLMLAARVPVVKRLVRKN